MIFLLFVFVISAGAVTQRECGRLVPDGAELIVSGQTVKTSALPWHAAIYSKREGSYQLICGGSLISMNIVLTGAVCVWSNLDKKLPASKFAVAVGKVHRSWNNTKDDAQKSDVKEIHIRPQFQGPVMNYQADIAVLIMSNAFVYNAYVRPVCLSFDSILDGQQLQTGNMGKIADWGPDMKVLQVKEVPYEDVATCMMLTPLTFHQYITLDKFCVKTNPNSALCRGAAGSGLSFPKSDGGAERYYLRGIASTAPTNDDPGLCIQSIVGFTHILQHEPFIKQFWNDSSLFGQSVGPLCSA